MDHISQEVFIMNLCDVVPEVNLMGLNSMEWWIDTGATRHLCSDKEMFASFEEFENMELFMGNSATSDIKSQGNVILKMASAKKLNLNNVLHVPEIKRIWCSVRF